MAGVGGVGGFCIAPGVKAKTKLLLENTRKITGLLLEILGIVFSIY